MSTEPIPQDLVAVHDLLRETLAASRDSGSGLGYGIAIFPGPDDLARRFSASRRVAGNPQS